jgi:hypothetical protein
MIDLLLGQVTLARMASNTPVSSAACLSLRVAQVLADIPLGEQVHFAQQEGAVVLGQHARLAGQLELDQRVHRLGIHEGERCRPSSTLQVGGGAQVGQQQEAVRHIGARRCRHRDAGIQQQALHVDKAGTFSRSGGASIAIRVSPSLARIRQHVERK